MAQPTDTVWKLGDLAEIGGQVAEMTGEPYEISPGVYFAEFWLENGESEDHALARRKRVCAACNEPADRGLRIAGNWLCVPCAETQLARRDVREDE